VGNADNKNPPGQAPNGSDPNNGYECDANNGIGKSNPAHTGCTLTLSTPTTTTTLPSTTTTTAPPPPTPPSPAPPPPAATPPAPPAPPAPGKTGVAANEQTKTPFAQKTQAPAQAQFTG
jgi:hypothetical protein